jgi:hypothetical protein
MKARELFSVQNGFLADKVLRARGFKWDFLLGTYIDDTTRRVAYIVGNGLGEQVEVQIFRVVEET